MELEVEAERVGEKADDRVRGDRPGRPAGRPTARWPACRPGGCRRDGRAPPRARWPIRALGHVEAERQRRRTDASAARAAHARNTSFAASGSQWMFHSVVGVVLPALRSAAHRIASRGAAAAARARASATARFVSGPSVTSVISPGRAPRHVDDDVDGVPVAQRARRRGQLRVTDARRPVCLGRRLERTSSGASRPSATSTSSRPASSSTPACWSRPGAPRRCRRRTSPPAARPPATRRRTAARGCRRCRCRRRGSAEWAAGSVIAADASPAAERRRRHTRAVATGAQPTVDPDVAHRLRRPSPAASRRGPDRRRPGPRRRASAHARSTSEAVDPVGGEDRGENARAPPGASAATAATRRSRPSSPGRRAAASPMGRRPSARSARPASSATRPRRRRPGTARSSSPRRRGTTDASAIARPRRRRR